MKKRNISILLTLLVFPGLGHLYLKCYKQGIAIILATLGLGIHFVFKIVGSVKDLTMISQSSSNQIINDFITSNSKTVLIYDAIFAGIWAYAIVDVYYKSKKIIAAQKIEEEKNNSNDEK